MALEKPTRGKPVKESIFIFQKKFIKYNNTQKISNQLISTQKINCCLDLRVEQLKSNYDFFYFLPWFSFQCTNELYWLYGPQNQCLIFFLENRAQKSTSKIVLAASKTIPYGLYGPAINVVVFTLIFVPSLLLSFPLICVLQFFFSCSGKMETFSLLSLSSLFSLQSTKVRQNAFPMNFWENPRVSLV